METVTYSTIKYISTKLLDQFIAQEGYGCLKRLFCPNKKYQIRLIKVIYKTIDGFNKKYPIDKNQLNKVPFYHSQILFEELNKYVLLKKNEDIGSLKEKFKQNPNIIIPTDEEIKEFYNLFIHEIEHDEELKKLFIEDNYKYEIYNISSIVEKIYKSIDFLPGDKWFEKQCKKSINDLGERYTQELNVDLGISDNFEAIGRTEKFNIKIYDRKIQLDLFYALSLLT